MSKQLIDLSPDLKRLRDEGYDIEIRSGYLLVKDVPYVNGKKEIKRGILVSELTTAGSIAAPPRDHVVDFDGEMPCDASGEELVKVVIERSERRLAENLIVHFKFSSKPFGGGTYKDYFEKMTAYDAILTSQAETIQPGVTSKTFPVITTTEQESIFEYLDTATSRAEIGMVGKKLELGKIAIIGVGGSGSYVLDLVAKTAVKEIHIFDRDLFLTHNAFRTPGAASVDDLNVKPKKVDYLKNLYSKMRRGVFAHDYHIDTTNVAELRDMNFVFLCIDPGGGKKLIVENLESFGVPFIDVGMGVDRVGDSLNGIVRVTTSTQAKRDHFRNRVSLTDAGIGDEYDRNIQIADLNSLNAALAVIKWKKLCGFYLDFAHEHHSTYSIDSNALTSDEQT